jgi:AcrR family transcriptional regulator
MRYTLTSIAMTRPKTISDDEILSAARKLFRAHGHAVSTRQVAESAGISEGVLYQRFVSKDELFFAAMAPSAPDLEEVLGPEEPSEPAREYVKHVVVRISDYFADVLPLALRLITHPSFDPGSLGRAQTAPAKLHEGLVKRLEWFEKQKKMRRSTADATAQLLVSLAHDWALGRVMSPRSSKRIRELEAMVEVVWTGTAPRS